MKVSECYEQWRCSRTHNEYITNSDFGRRDSAFVDNRCNFGQKWDKLHAIIINSALQAILQQLRK